MATYNFHVAGPGGSADTTTVILDNLQTAKCEAVRFAGEAICDATDNFWDRAEWTLTVTDDAGLTLFQLLLVGVEAPASLVSSRSPIAGL